MTDLILNEVHVLDVAGEKDCPSCDADVVHACYKCMTDLMWLLDQHSSKRVLLVGEGVYPAMWLESGCDWRKMIRNTGHSTANWTSRGLTHTLDVAKPGYNVPLVVSSGMCSFKLRNSKQPQQQISAAFGQHRGSRQAGASKDHLLQDAMLLRDAMLDKTRTSYHPTLDHSLATCWKPVAYGAGRGGKTRLWEEFAQRC